MEKYLCGKYLKMATHDIEIDELIRRLETDSGSGLSSEEASARLSRDGFNEFTKTRHAGFWHKFINQFRSFMILVLLLAAVISGITGYVNGEGLTDAIIILAILVVNAFIGVLQESKAEKSLDALEKLSAPHCKVVRDGRLGVIESRELVVGDIVEIETGDSIPADLRLVESVNLKVQEAALTGESVPVEKNAGAAVAPDAQIGDRINMVYSSCFVTCGRARGVVTATGPATEVGKIASMLQSVPQTKTPMQERLDQLGKVLAIICLAVCSLIMIIGLCYGRNLMEMFMTAVSLAVAAIPEGLPAVSTIVLALGVQRLAKNNAIVRSLPSVETLGSTTVICSDKTGTLTRNCMTVTSMYCDGKSMSAEEGGIIAGEMIKMAVLSNDASLEQGEEGKSIIGDPTETALVALGLSHDVDKKALDVSMPRIGELPFDSERKLMSTLHKTEDGRVLVAVKGGLDELLQCCTAVRTSEGTQPLTGEILTKIRDANMEMASKALRVLAVGYRIMNRLPEHIVPDVVERDMVFLGMAGMIDPPREAVATAVAQCLQAGIRPVMITGDHKVTAAAIVGSLGIMESGDGILTGNEVDSMDGEELQDAVRNVSVFARVAPEHKVRIVKAFQSNGNVVAMTGDGVNDAPALRLADIGVAMGASGTDVAKEAADVVLADDNFATIVSAVGEGRRIYDNLMKSIEFMLSTNIGEILLLLTAVVCNMEMPLLPIHLLFINLVGDSLPSLSLSVEPAEENVMKRRPVPAGQGIFTRRFSLKIAIRSMIIGGLSVAAYLLGIGTSVETARTMAFAVMIFSQLLLIFSIRTSEEWFGRRFFSNKWLWLTLLSVTAFTLPFMLIPVLRSMLKLSMLTESQWWLVAGLSVAALLLSELFKFIVKILGNLKRGTAS